MKKKKIEQSSLDKIIDKVKIHIKHLRDILFKCFGYNILKIIT